MELWHITHIRQTKELQAEGFSTNSIVNYNQWHLRNVHLRNHLANIDVRSNAETVVTRTGVATLTYHRSRWSRISSALLRPNFRGVVNKNAVQPTNHPVSRVFFFLFAEAKFDSTAMTSLTRHHTNPFFPVAFAVSQRALHLVHAGKPKKWDKNQQEHGKIGTDVKTRETEKQKKRGGGITVKQTAYTKWYNGSHASIRIVDCSRPRRWRTVGVQRNDNSNFHRVRWVAAHFLQKRAPSPSWRRNHWLKSGADPFFPASLPLSHSRYIFLYPRSSVPLFFYFVGPRYISSSFMLLPLPFLLPSTARTRELFGTEMWAR